MARSNRKPLKNVESSKRRKNENRYSTVAVENQYSDTMPGKLTSLIFVRGVHLDD